MKKCFLLSVTATLFFTPQISAGTITITEAQQVALNFFLLKTGTTNVRTTAIATLKYTQTEADNTIDFYVFDMKPARGFVIVAADDNIIPILAYSNESNFISNFSHSGFNHWVNKTAANIHLAIQHHAPANARIAGQWSSYSQGINPITEKSTPVGPLCTTNWDQENGVSPPPPYFYNLLCPFNTTDNQRCLTGCVATAQAQIMKYWNYPAYGLDSFSYSDQTSNGYSNNYGTLSSNFASHVYQWPIMPSVLSGTEPLAQDSAVDLLMYDCAVSVGMDFGDDNQNGSGAEAVLSLELQYGDSFCTQYSLIKYFSYDLDTIKGVIEANYTDSVWIGIIEHEMDMGRPVLYEGNDTTQGGHAWVCDGYDANNMLHMNWGWGGFANGYFTINNLTTPGNFNPVKDEDALIGILPKYPHAPVTDFSASFTQTCNGTVQFTDNSQYKPVRWLWNFGDGTTSTLQNPLHTYSANGTYTITLTAANPAGFSPKTINNYVTVNMLPAPTVTNVSDIGAQSFSLSATTSNTVGWFDSAGTLLSSSNPYITPVLNNTTTFYVEDSVISPTDHAGASHNQLNGGAYTHDSFAMKFNILSPCIIQSVYVYTTSAANHTIEVVDSSGVVIAQSTINCPTGGSRVTVNFKLNAGGPYFMQSADNLNFYRDTVGAAYPYTDALSLVSITGNTANAPASYYYFYDWVVKAPDCVSARIPVTASVTTGIDAVSDVITFNLFPNPATDEIVLQTNETGNELHWSLKNILGQTLISTNSETAQTHINTTKFAAGIYLVELCIEEKTAVKKLVINR